jgi:hypothetical protein
MTSNFSGDVDEEAWEWDCDSDGGGLSAMGLVTPCRGGRGGGFLSLLCCASKPRKCTGKIKVAPEHLK